MSNFNGLSEETYRFFWDIAFHNDNQYYENNKERYRTFVQTPLLSLAADLIPDALEMNPDFIQNPRYILSRIRRDTRFSKDKAPFRDYAWLGYKPTGSRTGEAFTVYADFSRESYGYGMGMYCPMPELMNDFRGRMTARPGLFLDLVNDEGFKRLFVQYGETFKKIRFPSENKEIQPWLNLKRISFYHESDCLTKTMGPDLEEEIRDGFRIMRPLYRFLMGLD